jgi:hypothetical protein
VWLTEMFWFGSWLAALVSALWALKAGLVQGGIEMVRRRLRRLSSASAK